jgi:transcriptional regulator with XRE-family HTH domain
MASKRQDKSSNACWLARRALNESRPMSLISFAELIGTSMSALYRRESARSAISGTPAVLYALLAIAGQLGLREEVIATLSQVPLEQRSETRSLMLVQNVLTQHGHTRVIEKIVRPDATQPEFLQQRLELNESNESPAMTEPDLEPLPRSDNICFKARKLVGTKGVTQKRWAELTGTHNTVIHRREYGTLAIQGTVEALYDLTIALCKDGLSSEVEAALEAVAGTRGEEKALLALAMLAVDQGRGHLVRGFLADVSGEDMEAKATKPSIENTLRLVSVLREDFERQARKAPPEDVEDLRQLARTFMNVEYDIKLMKQRKDEQQQAEAKPEGES